MEPEYVSVLVKKLVPLLPLNPLVRLPAPLTTPLTVMVAEFPALPIVEVVPELSVTAPE